MKITVDLTDILGEELLERAKLENITYSELVEQALYEYFDAIESETDDLLFTNQIDSNSRDPHKH